MDVISALGGLLLGLIIGFIVKPSTVVTTTTLTTLTTTNTQVVSTETITLTYTLTTTSTVTKFITKLLTTTLTTTLTTWKTKTVTTTLTAISYFPSTVYKVVTAINTTVLTTTLTLFKTLVNTLVTSVISVTTKTIYSTTTTVVTIYPQEVPKSSLPYLGPPLLMFFESLKNLKKTYEALSSKSNPIVEQFRKAMQTKFKLVAEVLNLQNDLNLLVRYYRDLIDSDKALTELMKQELNYNNIYKGYMYLLKMKVDMAMIDGIINKLGERIKALLNQIPAQDYPRVKKKISNLSEFLISVSKPMSAIEALPLLRLAESVGGPEAVVNAYLFSIVMELGKDYKQLSAAWAKAKAYFEEEYNKYYTKFSIIPS